MSTLSRRTFVKATAATAFAAAARAQTAPSERIRHAVIGLGGQGRRHARTFASQPDCDVVYVCDVDPERRTQSKDEIEEHGAVETVEHFQRILDDASIDSVSIVTPDHWHTPIALAALDAGKHVYVEKPCCHNVREGELLLKAAEASGKCVQHGTQRRSGDAIEEGIRFLRDGKLGKVRLAKTINHQLRGPIGRAEETDPPPGVNYDLWLGPAPKRPFTRNRWHYNWHWHWDYGTGDLGNDGVHHVDVARWGLGVAYPNAVSASGGQLFYDDDHETPDTQVVTFEYDDCYLLYEMRLWTDYPLEGHHNAAVFYGDNGTLEVGGDDCHITLKGEEPWRIAGSNAFGAHIRNYLDAVRANDPSQLNAPMREAVPSAALCHLGNIATRVGRKLRFDSEAFAIPGDDEAEALLTRTYRAGYKLEV